MYISIKEQTQKAKVGGLHLNKLENYNEFIIKQLK